MENWGTVLACHATSLASSKPSSRSAFGTSPAAARTAPLSRQLENSTLGVQVSRQLFPETFLQYDLNFSLENDLSLIVDF